MSELATITTPRLLLRPIQPEDGPALLPLIQNWNVVQWLAVVPWPYTADDMTWFIANIATPRAATPDPIFALLLDGQTPIGAAECKVEGDESGGHPIHLGFWLGEPYWGRGLMREAVAALITRAFARPKTGIIHSGVFDGNERSLRLHESLGFERTGTRPHFCKSQNKDLPLVTLALTRERFSPPA